MYYFDYYDPVRQPVRRVLAANQGWFRVVPGEPLTLSAWLKAARAETVAELVAVEAPEQQRQKQVKVGTGWERYEFTFKPSQPFIFVALGLNLEASHLDTATLWLDAVQLERGNKATDYEPRQALESFLETPNPGNLFTNPAQGLTFKLRAFNNDKTRQALQGQLRLTDFFDRQVLARTARLEPLSRPFFNRASPHIVSDRVP